MVWLRLITWSDFSRLESRSAIENIFDEDAVSHVAGDVEAQAGEIVAAKLHRHSLWFLLSAVTAFKRLELIWFKVVGSVAARLISRDGCHVDGSTPLGNTQTSRPCRAKERRRPDGK